AAGREVGCKEAGLWPRARGGGGDEVHGRSRSGRSELHNPEFGSGAVVDVEREAGLLGVKGERTVDVSDRQRDDLQGQHHGRLLVRKSRIAAAISLAWVSSAKWPVS